MLLLLLACPGLQSDTGVLDPEARDPLFTELSIVCDGAAGTWTITADADAWTGGGTLTLSADGDYVEAHPVNSTDAALDGTSDHLAGSLSVAADFRDVNEGSSTWFNCGTPQLQGLFVLYSRDAVQQTDCRRFGDDAGAWLGWGLGECGVEMEVESVD